MGRSRALSFRWGTHCETHDKINGGFTICRQDYPQTVSTVSEFKNALCEFIFIIKLISLCSKKKYICNVIKG